MLKRVYKRTKPVWNKGKRGIYHLSEETKKKISIANVGKNNSMYGKRFFGKDNPNWRGGPIKKKCIICESEFLVKKHRNQLAKYCSYKCSNKGVSLYQRGKNHYNWQGGKSYEPYSPDWTETLRVAIRQRDGYLCRLCGHNGYPIHHIDYNKKNCCPENLITLCQKCHSKTNYNREYWINYFKNL